jgi:hypothetical protein
LVAPRVIRCFAGAISTEMPSAGNTFAALPSRVPAMLRRDFYNQKIELRLSS